MTFLKMKKILFISYNYFPPTYSGKLIISGRRLQDLDPSRFTVKVLTAGLKGWTPKNKNGSVQIYRSPYIGSGKISGRLNVVSFWIWSFFMVIWENNIAGLHFDEVGYFSIPLFDRLGYRLAWRHFTLLAKIARKQGALTIFEHAISDSKDHFAPDPIKTQFLNQLSQIVCVSDALYEATRKVYPDKTMEITYGIEDDIFLPLPDEKRNQVRAANGADPSAIILGFVGLIVQRKGFDLICDVFSEICREIPECMLWVVGPKDHAESSHIHNDEVARYQAVLEPVKSHVKFFGNIQERKRLAELMAAMDIFVFPTRQEGFGLAPVEAMACGVPPVIARIPGVTDLANIDGLTGLYIEPDSREQLEQAVRALVQDQGLRQRMGKAARQRVEEKFSWQSHVKKWEDLYDHKG